VSRQTVAFGKLRHAQTETVERGAWAKFLSSLPRKPESIVCDQGTFVFRNRARLNQLLTLMRLAHLHIDNITDYSTDIRVYLEAHSGRPHYTYREAYDANTDEAGAPQLNSLWSVDTQMAMREARAKRASGIPVRARY
jgi:hypothetical protein